MYKIILLTILTTFAFAQNNLNSTPKPYAALGDVIYENVANIEKLKNVKGYEAFRNDIQKYVDAVKEAKEDGYKLENKKFGASKKEYLTKLRKLSKKNDYYSRSLQNAYRSSMKTNDYEQFLQIINNGLVDVNSSKKEIIDYYYKHEADINSTGVIENFLIEDANLKALKDAERKKYKSRKTLQEEKIQRIRANDEEAKIELENKLQKDLLQKKLKIRQNQKKELAN